MNSVIFSKKTYLDSDYLEMQWCPCRGIPNISGTKCDECVGCVRSAWLASGQSQRSAELRFEHDSEARSQSSVGTANGSKLTAHR